jgi:hypothetical protein
MITDVLIYETGNGGDLLVRGNDLATVSGVENSPYLALFGGSDWWGNYLTDNKFISLTEATLLDVALTSSGRKKIEDAVLADLAYLNNIDAEYSVSVTLAGANRVSIEININGDLFMMQWAPDELFINYQV